jgi:organic radical activating enzyme
MYYQEFIQQFPYYALYDNGTLIMRHLPYSITRRCTLNCDKCNQFKPDIKNNTDDSFETITQDFNTYFKFVDVLDRLVITGGEPFLHKQFLKIIEYIVDNFRERYLSFAIISNGTIVPEDDILLYLAKNDILLSVSDYTSSNHQLLGKQNALIDKLKSFQVPFAVNKSLQWFDYNLGYADNRFGSEKDINHHFDMCGYPCRFLKEKKLYFCTSDYCARQAGVIPSATENGAYYDLTEINNINQTKREIFEFSEGFVNERGYLLSCVKCYGGFTSNNHLIPVGIQRGESCETS